MAKRCRSVASDDSRNGLSGKVKRVSLVVEAFAGSVEIGGQSVRNSQAATWALLMSCSVVGNDDQWIDARHSVDRGGISE